MINAVKIEKKEQRDTSTFHSDIYELVDFHMPMI